MAHEVKKALYGKGVQDFMMAYLGPVSMAVHEDKNEAIDLAKNHSTSSKRKHIDVRYHFPRELTAGVISQRIISGRKISMRIS